MLISRLRLSIFPARADAEGWLYQVFMLSIPLALLVLCLQPDESIRNGSARALTVAFLCVVIHQFILQGILESRLPDVTGATVVLLAWLARRLSVRPLDDWTRENSVGVPALMRFVDQCLRPNDRPGVVSYAPEVFHLSERLFPGGISSFTTNGFNPSDSQFTRWLRGQSVPLVMVDERSREYFEANWPELAGDAASRYRPAAVEGFGDGHRALRILVDSTRTPARSQPCWSLPCFEP